jgi:hypothetical protein
MATPEEESPFAAFAEPKRTAVEDWRQRQQQARAVKRKVIRGSMCMFVGSIAGAAAGLSLAGGLQQLPFVLMGAVGGGVLGLALGVMLGGGCYSIIGMMGTTPNASDSAEGPQPNPVMRVLVVAWALIGVMVGSAWGGAAGLAWGGGPQREASTFPWAFIGSILGTALSGLVWAGWEARSKSVGPVEPTAREQQRTAPLPAATSDELPEWNVGVPGKMTIGEAQSQFDWSAVAPSDEHFQLALEEYHKGQTFSQIAAILQERGLSQELITDVITMVAQNRAFFLFSGGKKPAEVRDVLVKRGLSREEGEAIARAVAGSRERAYSSIGLGKWQMRSLATGGALLTAGVVLYGLQKLTVVDVPGELILGLLGAGVLLAGFGGVYFVFGME